MIPTGLAPHIEGAAAIRSKPDEFVKAFERRVEAGLLTGRPHPRSNYRSLHMGPEQLHISAADWLTAINVGLNEVELQAAPGSVRYQVWYWRWARSVLLFSGSLGVIGLVLMQMLDIRSYIASHRASMISGLSVDQNLQLAWSIVVFWGFVFPWLLIALHKRPLRRLVARLIGEVDSANASGERRV
jgi:hypothetical protein